MPITISILLIYAVIGGMGYAAVHFLGHVIVSQSEELIDKIPDRIEAITSQSKEIINKNAASTYLSVDKSHSIRERICG